MLDAMTTQDNLQVTTRKSADTTFRNDDLLRPGSDRRINNRIFKSRHRTTLQRRKSACSSITQLGKTLPETNYDIKDQHTLLTGSIDRLFQRADQDRRAIP